MSDGLRTGQDGDDTEEVLADLAAARRSLEAAQEAVESVGRTALDRLSTADGNLRTLFSKYEDRAIGTESFGAYVRFRSELDSLVEDLPDTLPARNVFEGIQDRFDKQRLHRSDFEWARSELDDVETILERRTSEEDARERYRRLRRTARARRNALEERLERLERLRDLSTLDLDAPVDRLRVPIDAYNEAVTAAFDDYRRTSSARTLVDFLETAERYPLIPLDPLPQDVVEYIETREAGLRPLPELLELADYSRSKLSHYVEAPDALKRAIATQRTSIERLDATPFRVGWPPPPADELRWRIRELLPLVGRFADEEVIDCLRTVRSLLDDADYDRLRRVAVARAELTEAERNLIIEERLSRTIEGAERSIERIEEALATGPDLR